MSTCVICGWTIIFLEKGGVTKDLQPVWNWIRYKIGEKMFAAVCLDSDGKPYYINLKLKPEEGDFLRHQYPDILPGYYSDKVHWNSVRPDGQVPDDLLREMLDESYTLVLGSLSKKQQRAALGISCCGTECKECPFYGGRCAGCNESCGKVFHAPSGKACPIYACSVQKKRYVSCAECSELPCEIWAAVRDPQLSDQQFEASIKERITNLGRE